MSKNQREQETNQYQTNTNRSLVSDADVQHK